MLTTRVTEKGPKEERGNLSGGEREGKEGTKAGPLEEQQRPRRRG